MRLLVCATFLSLLGIVHASAQASHAFFNVLDYGAHKDGSAPSTEAFARAIAAAHDSGGGTVYVPAGRYTSGPIEFFSNITLNLDAGATIAFPVAPLPFVKGRYLGVEALTPMPLVSGHDVENVAVIGRGTLTTGDFAAWASAYGPPPVIAKKADNANGPRWDALLKALEAGRAVSDEQYRAAAKELRPSFVSFKNSKNVLIDGIRIVGAPAFAIHLLCTENATVRNTSIEVYPGPHANGIVVDSSRFVRIVDNFVDSGDDGIVIKSGKDADGLRVNRPAEDVVISNCTVHHAHGAVVIGSETSGGIRNIVASNIVADGTEAGIRIKSRRGRGGVVEDLRFDNWVMRDVSKGIEITSYYTIDRKSVV
jgi:polygalacturonase